MPRLNTSPKVEERVQGLIKKLLIIANNELPPETTVPPQLEVHWQDDASEKPILTVETELKFLIEYAWEQPSTPMLKDQLRNDLRVLKEFLQILADTRTRAQGSKRWRFTLTLWHRSTQENLDTFREVWSQTKGKKHKPIDATAATEAAAAEE